VATLTQPPTAGKDASEVHPIAVVQMEFLVRFAPAEGLLAAQAQLTPVSYVLAPDCHLQGGFAFFSWFSGEHAGDFVTTLGGYHPQFQPPAHYPTVPRLGFNWQVNSEVLIKGEAYFALTPHAIMAGGSLNATFDSGDIHAWFSMGADFLMYWKPFHYTASAEVEIGASVTVHCFGTHTLTISAGAEVQIWGPPFAGNAHVHVKVLIVHVSFTVTFGDGSATPPPKIAWDEFQKTFLHDVDAAPAKVCSIAIQGGLIRTMKDDLGVPHAIVNAKELCLTTDALIPSTRLGTRETVTGDWKNLPAGTAPLCNPPAAGVPSLGIEPMGVAQAGFASQQRIRVLREGIDASADFAFVPVYKQTPRALWNPAASPTSSVGLNAERMVTAVTGFELHPAKPVVPGATQLIRDSALQYDVSPRDLITDAVNRVSYSVVPPTGPNSDGWANLKTALADPAAIERRRALLNQLGFVPARDVAIGDALSDSYVLPPSIMEASIS